VGIEKQTAGIAEAAHHSFLVTLHEISKLHLLKDIRS
jgi:hypothetical protein